MNGFGRQEKLFMPFNFNELLCGLQADRANPSPNKLNNFVQNPEKTSYTMTCSVIYVQYIAYFC